MKCGESDDRNAEYRATYTPEKFFQFLIQEAAPLIVDVGAHTGESATFLSTIFPKATIYSFEPDPDSFATLTTHMPPGSKALNLAVGSRTGTATFFRYGKSHLNSLYPINTRSVDSLGYAKNASGEPIEVRCLTLDDFVVESDLAARRVSLLKIDAQGGEIDILTGAQGMLSNVDNITLEVNLFDFYSKRSSFLEVERLLSGFQLYAITKVSQNPKNFRTDWAEVVYTKAGSA